MLGNGGATARLPPPDQSASRCHAPNVMPDRRRRQVARGRPYLDHFALARNAKPGENGARMGHHRTGHAHQGQGPFNFSARTMDRRGRRIGAGELCHGVDSRQRGKALFLQGDYKPRGSLSTTGSDFFDQPHQILHLLLNAAQTDAQMPRSPGQGNGHAYGHVDQFVDTTSETFSRPSNPTRTMCQP